MSGGKRVQITFTEQQWNLIETLKGEFGKGDADVVRNIVLSWLAEKSFISSAAKKRRENDDASSNTITDKNCW